MDRIGRQLNFIDNLKPNPSVEKEDEIRLSRQAAEIYNLFTLGPVRTGELAAIACQYNARINEIRKYLRPKGKTVDMTEKDPGGNNKYEIVDFHGSNYQQTLMKRGMKNGKDKKES